MLATAPGTGTAQGTIVGTLQDMAPEQVQGAAADARTDIFALGTILYEMATGRRAFEAKMQASLIAKILETRRACHLDLCATRAGCPRPRRPELHAQRTSGTVADGARCEIGTAVASRAGFPNRFRRITYCSPRSLDVAVVAPRRAGERRTRGHQRAASRGRGVTGSWHTRPIRGNTPGRHPRGPWCTTRPPSPRRTAGRVQREPEGRPQLFMRDLASTQVVPLDDTENGFFPFWSPDGRAVAFFANAKLKRITVSGGPATVLADASGWHRRLTGGGTWTQGTILFALANGSIVRVPDTGEPLLR